MVAKITEPARFYKAIYYNEHKVKEGVAELIGAENFLKSPEQLSMAEKIQRFEQLMQLNKEVGYNTLHISLNFHPSEKISKEKLLEIGGVYMDKIGFADQPYLVYQHRDTNHCHIHIVTTNIREDGTVINIHNIGRNQSQQARKEIEIEYNLIKAENRKRQHQEVKELDAQKLQYGNTEVKRGITNVLDTLLKRYKFSSLPELNAILSIYNVRVDRGEPESRIYKNKGLVYQLLDHQGQPIGNAIKASTIYFKPTLAFLEDKFKQHKKKDVADIERVKRAIDLVLRRNPGKLGDFIRQLRKEQLYVVARINKEGFLYGLTFVDTRNKVVINGSDIGKEYGAGKILERLGLDPHLQRLSTNPRKIQSKTPEEAGNDRQINLPFPTDPLPFHAPSTSPNADLWEILLRTEEEYEQTPDELQRDRKRKKRRQTPNK